MIRCFKKCFSNIFHFKSPKNDVKIYNHIFIAQEKENKVFQETLDFLEDSHNHFLKDYEDNFLRKFYNFELLVELFNRFKNEIWFSEESIWFLNLAFEELKISFRFNMIWYYTSAHIHLRLFIENIINFVYYFCKDKWLIKFNYWDNKKLKIEKCFKAWIELWKKVNTSYEEDIKYYFNTDEYYKIYSYLSNSFIHKSNINEIKFIEKEFNDYSVVFSFTLIFSARFINNCLAEEIDKYQKYRVLNVVEFDHPFYFNHIKYLIWFNWFFTNIYSEIYNIIHDHNKMNYDLIINKVWLTLDKIISPEYLEKCRISDECSKEAKWDKEKYSDLMLERYYNK